MRPSAPSRRQKKGRSRYRSWMDRGGVGWIVVVVIIRGCCSHGAIRNSEAVDLFFDTSHPSSPEKERPATTGRPCLRPAKLGAEVVLRVGAGLAGLATWERFLRCDRARGP